MISISSIASLLTSRLGGTVAWVLCLGLGASLGWYYIQAQRIPGLQAEIRTLEQEKRGALAALAQKDVAIGAIKVQTQNCYDAIRDQREAEGAVPLPKKPAKRQKQEVKADADKSADRGFAAQYNDLLR